MCNSARGDRHAMRSDAMFSARNVDENFALEHLQGLVEGMGMQGCHFALRHVVLDQQE